MIILSVGLINVNKWLMHADRFPFAVPLVLIHMVFCFLFALLLRFSAPVLFPSLTSETERVAIDRELIFKGFLPIAAVFSASLVLSNVAYTKLSLSFLQMLKETNLIWTYLLALLFAVEMFKWTSVKLICLALVAMALTIKGEMNFVLAGLMMQLGAIFCEAMRVVLQAMLLSGKKLDPLSYVLCTSPICGALLGVCALCLAYFPSDNEPEGMRLPSAAQLRVWSPCLLASALLAFCLNVSIAALIKFAGPMTYLMCQLVKDVFAVLGGVVALRETVTGLQVAGFVSQLTVVFLWSMARSFPCEFDVGLGRGIAFLVSPHGPLRMGKNKQEKTDTPCPPESGKV